MNSISSYLSQEQLIGANHENLLRLAKYLKLINFYNVEHLELAWIISMVLADRFLND